MESFENRVTLYSDSWVDCSSSLRAKFRIPLEHVDVRLAVPVQRLVVDMRAVGVSDGDGSLLARPLVSPARRASKAINYDAHARHVLAETTAVLDLEVDIWVDALLHRPQRIERDGLARLLAEALLVDEGDVGPGIIGGAVEEFWLLGAEPVGTAE
jgi:hypothetical protein